MLPPPPNKGRPRNLSATAAAAVLPTFRSRPSGEQQSHDSSSVSSLIVNNIQLIPKVCGNPMFQNMGKQAAKSFVQQQAAQLKGAIFSSDNETRNAQSNGSGSSKTGEKSGKGESSFARDPAEKELEDIFGPSLALSRKVVPAPAPSKSNFDQPNNSRRWSPPPLRTDDLIGGKWAPPPPRPPPPSLWPNPSQAPPYHSLYPDLSSLRVADTATESTTTGGCRAIALFDLDTGVPGDLKFSANDPIVVSARVNQDWLRGHLAHSPHSAPGIFPANFVHCDPVALSLLPFDQAPVRFVKALYDYNGEQPEDLSFRAGDMIELVEERPNSDWAMGKLGTKSGLVPLTFVEKQKQ